MKRPSCIKHKIEMKMHRLYVRIAQKFTAIGWICLKCGEKTLDENIIIDKNQKSILDFENKKVDK